LFADELTVLVNLRVLKSFDVVFQFLLHFFVQAWLHLREQRKHRLLQRFEPFLELVH